MAFAQQQRRPTQRPSPELSYPDDRRQAAITSDSENDWHVISSASNHSSPILFPSGSESSFRPLSDTESENEQNETFLPFHDGTGTFIVEDVEFFSSDQTTSQDEEEDSSEEFKSAIQNLNSEHSLLDLILQHNTPPSFAAVSSPVFQPTVSSSIIGVSSPDSDDNNKMISLISDEASHDNNMKFTSKLHKDLDRIPVHHPGIPGSSTSAAILSIVWDSLKRLTNHILENDTNTVETLGSLMSEAILEGCIPFGSHLHMDIVEHHNHHYHSRTSLLEGN